MFLSVYKLAVISLILKTNQEKKKGERERKKKKATCCLSLPHILLHVPPTFSASLYKTPCVSILPVPVLITFTLEYILVRLFAFTSPMKVLFSKSSMSSTLLNPKVILRLYLDLSSELNTIDHSVFLRYLTHGSHNPKAFESVPGLSPWTSFVSTLALLVICFSLVARNITYILITPTFIYLVQTSP